MKELLVVFAAACFAQAAIAADPGDAVNPKNVVKSSVAVASAVSAPVQLSDVEMDRIVAGGDIAVGNLANDYSLANPHMNQGPDGNGKDFLRDNTLHPGQGAIVCKNAAFITIGGSDICGPQ